VRCGGVCAGGAGGVRQCRRQAQAGGAWCGAGGGGVVGSVAGRKPVPRAPVQQAVVVVFVGGQWQVAGRRQVQVVRQVGPPARRWQVLRCVNGWWSAAQAACSGRAGGWWWQAPAQVARCVRNHAQLTQVQ